MRKETHLQDTLVFSVSDLAGRLKLGLPSARVAATRKTKSGELIRLRRDLYVFSAKWNAASESELFSMANMIQTPSYISMGSALSYHGISTQIFPDLVESLNKLRSNQYEVQDRVFKYYYGTEKYYFGFYKENGFFIAYPEKAAMDALYFISLGRYALDRASIDFSSLNKKKTTAFLKNYPKKFRSFFYQWSETT